MFGLLLESKCFILFWSITSCYYFLSSVVAGCYFLPRFLHSYCCLVVYASCLDECRKHSTASLLLWEAERNSPCNKKFTITNCFSLPIVTRGDTVFIWSTDTLMSRSQILRPCWIQDMNYITLGVVGEICEDYCLFMWDWTYSRHCRKRSTRRSTWTDQVRYLP